jgi:hypothetical protein
LTSISDYCSHCPKSFSWIELLAAIFIKQVF